MVLLFDTKAQHAPIESELLTAFQRVLRSGQFILGPEVQHFENDVGHLIGARHAIGTSSGTDAILLALMTLGLGPGDEVICPSFTFFATAGCVARVGATPVFADSCPVCFNLDVADAASRITPRTKAIIPVHLFGQAAEMDAIMALSRRHNLAVIEDAAQAIGAEYRGRKLGSLGTFGAFSFFPTKNLGACGDAGLLVTNDDALADRARLLRTHGARQKYFHQSVGANFRLDALQAAFLTVKLSYLETYTVRRRENAAFYTDQLCKLPGVAAMNLSRSCCQGGVRSGVGASRQSLDTGDEKVRLILPVAYSHNAHIWNQYTIRVVGEGQRDALKARLSERGIGAEVYYPIPLHRQECFIASSRTPEELPAAEVAARECLSLPIYPELNREQLQEVVDGIAGFLV